MRQKIIKTKQSFVVILEGKFTLEDIYVGKTTKSEVKSRRKKNELEKRNKAKYTWTSVVYNCVNI